MKTGTGSKDAVVLTAERIGDFLDHLEEQGCGLDSQEVYRRKLKQLYEFLGADKRLDRTTLERWRDHLEKQGYSAHTVNSCVYAANSYLDYAGLREYQLTGLRRPDSAPAEELTRAEYLRLLSTARLLGNEQLYLMVKTFALTGVPVGELHRVTAQAAERGEILLEEESLPIPECLREELLSFARREGLERGPLFVTRRERKRLGRTVVTQYIRQLCRQAQIPEEKGSPRYLRRLYQNTRREIEENVSALIRREQERMADQEQRFIGWDRDEKIQRLG